MIDYNLIFTDRFKSEPTFPIEIIKTSITFPLDSIKTRMQLGYLKAIPGTGIYRGMVPKLISTSVAGTVFWV